MPDLRTRQGLRDEIESLRQSHSKEIHKLRLFYKDGFDMLTSQNAGLQYMKTALMDENAGLRRNLELLRAKEVLRTEKKKKKKKMPIKGF